MADLITAKQLREERAPLVTLIKELNDKAQAEKRDFNAEEKGQWERLNGEYDGLSARINIAERAEKLILDSVTPIDEQRSNGNPVESRQVPGRENYDGRQERLEKELESRKEGPTEEHRALALQAWLRASRNMDLRPEHQRACELVGARPHSSEFSLPLRRDHYGNIKREYRALSAQSGVAGNFTVKEGFVPSLEMALLQYGGVRQAADVMRTTGDGDMPWPTSNDSSNKGRIIGENVAATSVDPTFGRVVFRAYKWTSDFIRVPVELLEDSAFNLASILGAMLGERLGRIQNEHYTTGDGVNKPRGFVTAATAYTAASATAISHDDLINLKHAVDPAYRGNAIFMAHDAIWATIRKLKDGQGRYLWESSTVVGEPDRIQGSPAITNQDMSSATIASTVKTVAYGDFSKYKIRDVGDIRMRRLGERFADQDQEGFIAFVRGDANLLDAGTNPIKVLTH
jgi:HK97 family phage major capsid protein